MFRTQTSEVFNIPEIVSNNLLDNEKVIYKLKIRHFTYKQRYLQLFFLTILICCFITLFSTFGFGFFTNSIIINFSLIIITVLSIIMFIKSSFHLEFFIIITQFKFFLFGKISVFVYTAAVFNISSIQSLNIEFKNVFKDIGKFELILDNIYSPSNPSKKNSIFTPSIKGVSKILQNIESILRYYKESKHELENFEIAEQNQNSQVTKQLDNIKIEENTKNVLQDKVKPFLDHINKEEKIFFTCFPKVFYDIALLLLIFILGDIYLFFLIFSIIGITISNLLWFTIFSLIILFPLILNLPIKPLKFLFTSQKILIRKGKKFILIPYYKIIAVTHQNKIRNQEIQIHFKEPVKGFNDGELVKITFKSPKKHNLYLKILRIIKSAK